MRIDIEDIRKLLDEKQKFNKLDLDDVEFYENGEKLNIPKEIYDNWFYIGLNNLDFISTGYYKNNDFEQVQHRTQGDRYAYTGMGMADQLSNFRKMV